MVFGRQGEPLSDSILRKTRQASALQWHPTKKILATGWETGEVVVRNEHEGETYETQPLHRSEITVLHWSSNGLRLVSGDSVRY